MRWTVAALALSGALLAAGCTPADKQSLHATLDADLDAGDVTMKCTESSSGTCHALLVTGDDIARISAAVGASAGTAGVSRETRFCLDVSEPTDGCNLRPLVEGEQIVRREKAH